MANKKIGFGTKIIHAGQQPDSATGAVTTPIYQTSTFYQTSPGEHKGFAYSRVGNPTRKALEDNLAALENGNFGLCFGSGVAAIDAVMKLLKPGDEVISTRDLYGGSYRLFTQIVEPFGISFKFIPMHDTSAIEANISSNTKLIWVETPTNPIMSIIDIATIGAIAKKNNVLLAVDNTFATPYLQTPLDLGADIVMHSATKYLGGHSDVIMGALVCKDKALAERLYFIQKSTGAICGPQDSYLVLRGVKTLHVRMQRHCENAKIIAHFLNDHTKVAQVHWPGFDTHPNHEVAQKQMKDYGGMVSFSLKDNKKETAFRVMSSFKLFVLAESLGGVESLVAHPASMSHATLSKKQREEAGVLDSLIRLSVGIEDVDDLKEDLEEALGSI